MNLLEHNLTYVYLITTPTHSEPPRLPAPFLSLVGDLSISFRTTHNTHPDVLHFCDVHRCLLLRHHPRRIAGAYFFNVQGLRAGLDSHKV